MRCGAVVRATLVALLCGEARPALARTSVEDALPVAIGRGAWNHVGGDADVDVWMRDVEGTDVREVKAQRLVPMPAASIWSVLKDVESYPEFIPFFVEVRVLSRPDAHTALVYQYVEPPVVSPRDTVVEVKTTVDERLGVYMSYWHSVDNGPEPSRRGAIRSSDVRGQFTLERLTSDQSRLAYYFFTEPGGSVPAWLLNRALRASAPDVLNAVAKRVPTR